MAALLEAVDLYEPPAPDEPVPVDLAAAAWTPDELETAARLLAEVEADEQRWMFGDFLLRAEPMAAVDGTRTGSHARLADLAGRIGCRAGLLRSLRTVSHAWPRQWRPDFCGYAVCRLWTTGGPRQAPARLAALREIPRNARDRLTIQTFQVWHRENVPPSRGGGPVRLPTVKVSPWLLWALAIDHGRRVRGDARQQHCEPVAQSEYREVLERTNALIEDISVLVPREPLELWQSVARHLDDLVADVSCVAQALEARPKRRAA